MTGPCVRLEDLQEVRDAESYGQGRAIANSAGTPVLMSNAYDVSFSARPEWRFGDVQEGARLLEQFTGSTELRPEMRAFAERRDSMVPGLERYAILIGADYTPDDLVKAVAEVEDAESAGHQR